jgi:hypothetical protein
MRGRSSHRASLSRAERGPCATALRDPSGRSGQPHTDINDTEHTAQRKHRPGQQYQPHTDIDDMPSRPKLSLHNQLLIAHQRSDAAYVCGFRAWIELGYCVRKGECAIRILAPQKVLHDDAADCEDEAETQLFVRVVPVFDRAQVDPLPDRDQAPLEPLREPITGDSHARLLEPLEALACELGYRVTYRDTGPADGWCDDRSKTIAVGDRLAVNRQVAVVVHEIAHALGIDYETHRREVAEVLVDTVTYIVCAGVGLDVGGEAVPYVAGWGEDDAAAAATVFAETIDQVAKRIETAIGPHDDERDGRLGDESRAA